MKIIGDIFLEGTSNYTVSCVWIFFFFWLSSHNNRWVRYSAAGQRSAQLDSSELIRNGSRRELTENQRIGLRASSQDNEATLFCFWKEVSSRLIIVLQEKEH